MKNEFTPIKDYYIIGDLHTAALVSKSASIDWMCIPQFDSPSIFAKILDMEAGCFSLDSTGYTIKSKYRDNTAIVEFFFESEKSRFILKDFMLPIETDEVKKQFLVRKFSGFKGESKIKAAFAPVMDYGKEKPSVKKFTDFLEFGTNGQRITLHFPPGAEIDNTKHYTISFNLKENETKFLVLEIYNKNEKASFKNESEFEKQTTKFWENWVKTGEYFEYKHELLVRSMITLKLLQCHPNGSLIAAATTSLPAEMGGVRNWDYRFTWIRDATFTLFAFHILDCEEEQYRFFNFIYKIMKKNRENNFEINTLYTINGDIVQNEKHLDYLSGYKNSKPVRVGNDATDQFQMDIYAVLIDAHYFMMNKKFEESRIDTNFLLRVADRICKRWRETDHGIWEIRRTKKHYTYSKVMSWVGIDRIIRLKDTLNLSEEKIKGYETTREEIKNWIWENCYNKEKKTFEQFPGAGYQDATNFLFVLLQFLDKHDPLTKVILENTSKELCENEIWVHRYKNKDGLEGKDDAFLLCTFWMISAWAILEDVERAENILNKFLPKIAESGLMSEQMNPQTGEYLGNFPQAYSHLGLTMAIYYIHKYKFGKTSKEKVL